MATIMHDPLYKPRKKKSLSARPGYIVPYIPGSRSAKALSKELGLSRTFNNMAGEKARAIDVINWGSGTVTAPWLDVQGSKLYNPCVAVNLTRNKLKLFKRLRDADQGPRIPVFYETLEEAMEGIRDGCVVWGRSATGSCGTDIVSIDQNVDKFNSSDFWVVYKKKKAEFRIHIFKRDGEPTVIDCQQKVLRKTDPETGEAIDRSLVDFMIRNHRNGFIFQRNEIEVPEDVKTQAIRAFALTGLDFGAVDVIWNEKEGQAYVLEINTAPGLEGTTLDNYIAEFRRLGIGKTKKSAAVEEEQPDIQVAV